MARFALVLYCLVLAFVVLWPTHVDDNAGGERLLALLSAGHSNGWLPLWFGYSEVEWLSNVAMFVPGAFLLTLLLPKDRRWLAVVLSVLTTCSIESAQYFMPNRTSSFLDILANSLGGVLGWALGILLIYCVTVRFLAQSSVK